jgi:CHAP domain
MGVGPGRATDDDRAARRDRSPAGRGSVRSFLVAAAVAAAVGLALPAPAIADTDHPTGGTSPQPSSPARTGAPGGGPPVVIPVSGTVRTRIVALARSQLGQAERPPGSNCTRFGPCEAWCAHFATWVWRQSRVPRIGRIAWVPALVAWAQQHRAWKPGYDNDPQPGDMAIFSGLHVGIVERVLPTGAITIIAGNTSTNNVARRGPASPSRGSTMGPAAISGYVSPTVVAGSPRAGVATALPRPTPAQMAAQDPQDHAHP